MSKPTILTVDDDPAGSAAITRDLGNRYGAAYPIGRAASGAEALTVLTRLALRDQPVALIAPDQRMPEMTGIEMLDQARTHALGAKFLLLTAYTDTDVAIKAVNDEWSVSPSGMSASGRSAALAWARPRNRSVNTRSRRGALGLRARAEQPLYDLCIVGLRPSGPGCRGVRSVRGPEARHRGARGATARQTFRRRPAADQTG